MTPSTRDLHSMPDHDLLVLTAEQALQTREELDKLRDAFFAARARLTVIETRCQYEATQTQVARFEEIVTKRVDKIEQDHKELTREVSALQGWRNLLAGAIALLGVFLLAASQFFAGVWP